MPTTTRQAETPQTRPFVPGDSYYQVLCLAALVGPNGEQGYDMWGPFPDLESASAFASVKPGALITVTLVLHHIRQAVAAPPPGQIRPIK